MERRSSTLSQAETRARLASNLRDRADELQAATATRVHAIDDPSKVTDASYVERLGQAMQAAIEHRLDGLQTTAARAPAVPPPLLAQARLDARVGVPLDTVLRRHFAANALFEDFLVEEAERAGVTGAELRRLLAAQSTLFDRLVTALGIEYAEEAKRRPINRAERRRECVKQLLAGELVDHSDLAYDLDAHHVGLLARGFGADTLLRELADRLDRRILAVQREEEPTWAAWLGGGPLEVEGVVSVLGGELAREGVVVTVGEDAKGITGWRFSHLQAKAAVPIAEQRGVPVLRYLDVAVLVTVRRDELTATSLRRRYLEPLDDARDGGTVARDTLRAYFTAERSISSTAAALRIDRRTVRNRLRAIEHRLGCSLAEAGTDLEVALRLDE